MTKPIRKAVLPVAGLGTRFLPATKAIPKEMLTVVDRPILQHVVDEARAAGVEQFIFVTGRNKGVIEDHFDTAYELEDTLKRRGKIQGIQGADGRSAEGRLRLVHPPAGAARPRPCGVVRARARRRRAVRGAAARHGHQGGARKTRCLAAVRRGLRRSTAATSSRSRRFPTRRRTNTASSRSARISGHTFEIKGMVEKPTEGHRALESDHFRPLHPAAGDFRHSRDGREGRGRRDPAHRRHDRALAPRSRSTACASTGAPMIAARSIGFLTANIAFALEREDLAPLLRAEARKLGL